MGRHIEITIPEYGVSAVAELLEQLAPHTCQQIWEILPFQGICCHASTFGSAIVAHIPASEELPKEENQTIYPIPGDLFLYYYPAERVHRIPKEWEGKLSGLEKGVLQVVCFYGRNSIPFGWTGPIPGNRFGSCSHNLDNFGMACQRVYLEGCTMIQVSRSAEQ